MDVGAGVEASALNGTKVYGSAGLNPNAALTQLKLKAVEKSLGRALTSREKELGVFGLFDKNTRLSKLTLWKGQYKILEPGEALKMIQSTQPTYPGVPRQ